MKTLDAHAQTEQRRQHVLTSLAGLLDGFQRGAVALDSGASYPARDMEALRDLGLLAAPLPEALGGLGLGTAAHGALALMEALRLLGRGNLSLGRLIEAHVNAIRLVIRCGTPEQGRQVAEDALAGHVFALWVTDAPGAPLGLGADGILHGAKAPCSGAGYATRALVTAALPSGETAMFIVGLEAGARATGGWGGSGMRAACNGHMDLSGLAPLNGAVGAPGDYVRQPDFSAGAWRTSAVTLGGLEALVSEFRNQLVLRGRGENPHQRGRVGEALIAQETARLWIRRAALLAEDPDSDAEDCANTVNLARIAAETATLRAMEIVQRGLGMAAFRAGSLTELLFRDLAIYLRQPAPDETLTEAAAHFMQRDLPALG
jgi:alkylation response protein AidB-like acyl-CoA dehydrogenase